MGHHCEYRNELKLINGMLALQVYARYKEQELDIYYELENGKKFYRANITFNCMSGYTVNFPGEKIKNYYYYGGCYPGSTYPLYDYEETQFAFNTFDNLKVSVKEMLALKPEYKYLLTKMSSEYVNFREFVKLLNAWKNNMKLEFLLMSGYEKLAYDNRFLRFKETKQREILKELNSANLTENEKKEYTMTMYYYCRKRNLPYNDYQMHILGAYTYNFGGSALEIAKLTRKVLQKYDKSRYEFYHSLCKSLKKNWHDEYWYLPNNLEKQMKKLEKEKENIEKNKALALTKKLNELKVISKKTKQKINDYVVYIPFEKNDIEFQANQLKQCLITCDYLGKHSDREGTLVFIRKNNGTTPIATAWFKGKKLDQFYANESDRTNCTPDEEVKSVLESWQEKNANNQHLYLI